MKIIDSINNISLQLVTRLYTRGSSKADRQRGASALEYIILAVVLIAIIAYLGTSDSGLKEKLSDVFSSVFDKASSAASSTAE